MGATLVSWVLPWSFGCYNGHLGATRVAGVQATRLGDVGRERLGPGPGPVPSTTYLLPSTWYQVLGIRYLVQSTWHQVLGTKYLEPSTWYQVLGTRYLVPSTWYQVLGTKYLVPSTWYLVPALGLGPGVHAILHPTFLLAPR